MDLDHLGRAVIALFLLWVAVGSAIGVWQSQRASKVARIVVSAVLVVGGAVAVYFLMTDDEVAWCFRTDHPSCHDGGY